VRAIPLGRVGLDLCVREVAGERLDLALLGRELEVHGGQTTGVRWTTIILTALALAGCGGHKTASAEQVTRAWSAALNRDDNEAAARLFADGALIVQNGSATLESHADAVRWNAGLPCGGRITRLELHGKDEVVAQFELIERPRHSCDAPGGAAAAVFQVKNGKIVVWHQAELGPDDAAPTI
jgi:limonene-1,2-epoxide hydrolase